MDSSSTFRQVSAGRMTKYAWSSDTEVGGGYYNHDYNENADFINRLHHAMRQKGGPRWYENPELVASAMDQMGLGFLNLFVPREAKFNDFAGESNLREIQDAARGGYKFRQTPAPAKPAVNPYSSMVFNTLVNTGVNLTDTAGERAERYRMTNEAGRNGTQPAAAKPQQPVQKPVQPVAPQQPRQPQQPVQPQQQAAQVQARQSVPPAQATQVQQPQQIANTNQNQAAPSPNDAQAGARKQARVRTRKEAPSPAPKPIEPGYRQYVTPEGKVLKGVSVPVAPQPPSSRPAGGSYAGFRTEEMVTPSGRLRSPQEIMHNRREQAYRNRTMYKRSSILDPELVSAGFDRLGQGDGMEKLALSPEVVGRALKAVRSLPVGRRVNSVTGRLKGSLEGRKGFPMLERLAAEEDRVNGIIDGIVARPEWQRRAAALHAGNPQAYFRDVADAPFGMMDALGKTDWLLMRNPLRGSAATYLNSSLIPRVRSLAYGPGRQPAADLFGNTLRYMNTASLSAPDGVWTDVLKNGFGV